MIMTLLSADFHRFIDNMHIIARYVLRIGLHILGCPPFDGFGETACQVVDQKIFLNFLGEQHCIAGEQLYQVLLEIGHEQTVTIRSNDAEEHIDSHN